MASAYIIAKIIIGQSVNFWELDNLPSLLKIKSKLKLMGNNFQLRIYTK